MAKRIVKKISNKTIANRIIRLGHEMANAWGIQQDKALALESQYKAMLQSHKDVAMQLVKTGYVLASDCQ